MSIKTTGVKPHVHLLVCLFGTPFVCVGRKKREHINSPGCPRPVSSFLSRDKTDPLGQCRFPPPPRLPPRRRLLHCKATRLPAPPNKKRTYTNGSYLVLPGLFKKIYSKTSHGTKDRGESAGPHHLRDEQIGGAGRVNVHVCCAAGVDKGPGLRVGCLRLGSGGGGGERGLRR